MAWYSSLGKVKLSRTSLGFLSFCTSTTMAFDVALALVLTVAGVFLAAGFVAAFLAGRRTRFLAAGALAALLDVGATVSEVVVCVVSVDMFKKSGS